MKAVLRIAGVALLLVSGTTPAAWEWGSRDRWQQPPTAPESQAQQPQRYNPWQVPVQPPQWERGADAAERDGERGQRTWGNLSQQRPRRQFAPVPMPPAQPQRPWGRTPEPRKETARPPERAPLPPAAASQSYPGISPGYGGTSGYGYVPPGGYPYGGYGGYPGLGYGAGPYGGARGWEDDFTSWMPFFGGWF